jgi:broad specificity phosphatase PhoE
MDGYIYLIRHGEPLFPNGRRFCLGSRHDLVLTEEGKLQAEALKGCFMRGETVYCSTLKRSIQTAELFAERKPVVISGFDEIDMGNWDGLTFREIREIYPENYARRGEDWSLAADGGESLEEAAGRVLKALDEIEDEEAAVVTHGGIIRSLIWKLKGIDASKAPIQYFNYGSITVLKKEKKQMLITAENKMPDDHPSGDEIRTVLEKCGISGRIPDVHAVCPPAEDKLRSIAEGLKINLTQEQIGAAAKIYAVLQKEKKEFAVQAASLLRELGYMKTAYITEKIAQR